MLFVILPIGIVKEDNVKDGNDPGAPKNPQLKNKIIISSVVSFFLTIIAILVKNAFF